MDIDELREYFRADEKGNIYSFVSGRTVGCVNAKGYRTVYFKGKIYQAARVVYALTYGIEPQRITYKDGNISNLAPDNLINEDSACSAYIKAWKEQTGYKDVPHIYPTYSRGKVRFAVKLTVDRVVYSSMFNAFEDALNYAYSRALSAKTA